MLKEFQVYTEISQDFAATSISIRECSLDECIVAGISPNFATFCSAGLWKLTLCIRMVTLVITVFFIMHMHTEFPKKFFQGLQFLI